MSDQSSGRNDLNSGSDSAKHHGTTAHEAFSKAGSVGKATGTTGKLDAGYVGTKPQAAPTKGDVRS
jgi:hypothetical protein